MIIDEPNNNIFIIEKLNGLKNAMNKDKLNLEELRRKMENISEYNNYDMYEYLNAMLDPIKNKGGKVPSKIPIPTCSFQLHNSFTFHNNYANGNNVFTLNPFFLASDACKTKEIKVGNDKFNINVCSTYFFLRNEGDGSTPDSYWTTNIAMDMTIPDVYDSYRLVSACMTVKYVGVLEEAKGMMGGCIAYEKNDNLAARFHKVSSPNNIMTTTNTNLKDFANFELIRDSYYHTENTCLEGIKMLYFPLDNSFEEFKKVFNGDGLTIHPDYTQAWHLSTDYFKPGFNWFVYFQNTPFHNVGDFRLDYYLNFECIPKAEFLNYMPVSVSLIPYLPSELKKKFIDEVKDKAASKLNKLNIY